MVKSFFLIIIVFLRSNSQIKQNPILLNDKCCPFVLSSSDDNYYVITCGEDLKIEKESGNISSISNNYITSNNFIGFVSDINSNNYIIYSDIYYYINYNPFISYANNQINLISENEDIHKVGVIARNNDLIVYGYLNKKIYFCYISQEFCSSYEYNNKIQSKLLCKLIEENYFICAMNINRKLSLKYLTYSINYLDYTKNSLTSFDVENIPNFQSKILVCLFDTVKKIYKNYMPKKRQH